MKSRRMGWAGHVARMKERRGAYRVVVGKMGEGDHSEDPDVDWRLILRWISRKWDGGMDLAQDRDRWRAFVNAMLNHWAS